MTGRSLCASIVAATSLAGLACGAPSEGTDGALIATARIVGRKFCLGTPIGGHATSRGLAPDAISINLGVQVSYRNVSTNPAILLLLSNWRVVLSPSLKNAAHLLGQTVFPYHELTPTPPWGLGDLPALDAGHPEPNLFRIVPPGGMTEPEGLASISFQIHKPSADGTGVELLGKKAFFQLELDHGLIPRASSGPSKCDGNSMESFGRAKSGLSRSSLTSPGLLRLHLANRTNASIDNEPVRRHSGSSHPRPCFRMPTPTRARDGLGL